MPTAKEDALVYCETHGCWFQDGEFCPSSEYGGGVCEYAAEATEA